MNHQFLTQRFFRYVPALFTLTALGLVGWAVVDRPAPPTTAAAVSLTTTSAADGTLPAAGADVRRLIEDVRVGDRVWAYDEQTGQLEKRPVTALFRSQTDHLRVLTLESESGQRQRIETTDEHPFWVVGFGWQDAQLLRPGDRLLEPDQSQVTVISSVREEHPDGLTVYNFEGVGLHDYFVSATATDSLVLSHNMSSKGDGGANLPTPRHTPVDSAGNKLPLPRTKHGEPAPTVEYPHTQIGWREGRRGGYHQTREFGEGGRPIKDVDWTDHGRPGNHTNPHVHDFIFDPNGGTPGHGPARPPRPGELGGGA